MIYLLSSPFLYTEFVLNVLERGMGPFGIFYLVVCLLLTFTHILLGVFLVIVLVMFFFPDPSVYCQRIPIIH